jgi:hypothetical protein
VQWVEEEISSVHDRAAFDCGNADLNAYLRTQARRQHDNSTTRTFVVVPEARSTTILGYYSLAQARVRRETVPEHLTRRLGNYDVPFILLGRLAVRIELQRTADRCGSQLFVQAAHRAYRASRDVGGIGLVIDAINEEAIAWYERFGAVALPDSRRRLFLPWAAITPSFPS